MSDYHKPVLIKEVIDRLRVTPGKTYIDATIGGGGHGWEIVKKGGILLGIDVDGDAVEHAKEEFRIKNYELRIKENWKIIQGNFRDIEQIARLNGFGKVDDILFDLGVSSHQLDTPGRGFSYRFQDAPLDLRLDQNQGEPAASLVNQLSEEKLYEIFAHFGEEELAHPIARAVCRARSVAPIETAGQLATIITSVEPNKRAAHAVLSRIFQALRIAVNDEMGALREGLSGASNLLVSGGRLAVISFHSLEDRAVKQFFQNQQWKTFTKKPMVAGRDEIKDNPRARSAKLRVAEKI